MGSVVILAHTTPGGRTLVGVPSDSRSATLGAAATAVLGGRDRAGSNKCVRTGPRGASATDENSPCSAANARGKPLFVRDTQRFTRANAWMNRANDRSWLTRAHSEPTRICTRATIGELQPLQRIDVDNDPCQRPIRGPRWWPVRVPTPRGDQVPAGRLLPVVRASHMR